MSNFEVIDILISKFPARPVRRGCSNVHWVDFKDIHISYLSHT